MKRRACWIVMERSGSLQSVMDHGGVERGEPLVSVVERGGSL